MLRAKRNDPDLTVSVGREVAPGPHDAALPWRARTPVRMPAPGEIVGRKYRIEQWLGQGGMGAVFSATQLVSEKPVALKWMLRPGNPQARARFLREARAVGRIRHPNVVDIYDVGRDGEIDYLVMELLRGESLRARLDRGALCMTEAVDLLLPAMHGIAAAHRAAVIHRDLKPDNVFLCEDSDGRAGEAKVLDFGISQITSADADDPAITREGAVLGTPMYMSPEQLKSARDVDVRTDVYSFGVILYEAVTGRPPFSDPSFSGLVLAIAQADPPAPSSLVPDLPLAFEQVLLKAIARDRERRYPDMDSFVAAARPFGARYLNAHPGGQAPEQEDPARHGVEQAGARAQDTRRRSWLWAALVTALATSLLAAWWIGRSHDVQPTAAPSALITSSERAAAAPVQSAYANERAADSPPAASEAEAATVPDVIAADVLPQSPRADAPRATRKARAPREAHSTRARVTAATSGSGTAPALRGGASLPSAPGGNPPVSRSGTISLDDM